MATEVKLPRLGQGMESGTIVRWLKTEGDAVAKGEPLYELDTDKVTQEVEADSDGVLLKIVVAEGEVDVGTTVGSSARRTRTSPRCSRRAGEQRRRRRAPATAPRQRPSRLPRTRTQQDAAATRSTRAATRPSLRRRPRRASRRGSVARPAST